eukprot:c11518_g1_i1.p1 GENE.c11518_g1_i1~~c11518_g1_i1.p1  ORF type:complete len:1230 (+),score=287.00 c11518_g1_i1:431-3691(+)
MTICRTTESDCDTVDRVVKAVGQLPIMVLSNKCHLFGMTPKQLVKAKEEEGEQGGYFVINGGERCIRMLVVPKRNHVMALYRSSMMNRGPMYTPYLTSIRCVRPDQSAQSVTVHYLNGGLLTIRSIIRRQEFFLPYILVLRALMDVSDRTIYESIVQPARLPHNKAEKTNTEDDKTFLASQVESMIAHFQHTFPHLTSQRACLTHLGQSFRAVLGLDNEVFSDLEVGKELLRRHFFVHINNAGSRSQNSTLQAQDNRQKFSIAVYMAQKVYALAEGRIQHDNADALDSQEVLLPGHLFCAYLREKLDESLAAIVKQMVKDVRMSSIRAGASRVDWDDPNYFRKAIDKSVLDIGSKFQYTLATGNLQTSTGLDLMQTSGYTIVAEKLNYFRFLSHFRSIHRGSFFAELRTTEVRKLLPESWGFLCPVHTPDGSPCGLLNHLTQGCDVMTIEEDASLLPMLLTELGMVPAAPSLCLDNDQLPVFLNGVIVGSVHVREGLSFANELRSMKAQSTDGVPKTLEIVPILSDNSKSFPGIFLSSAAARPTRRVMNLALQQEEIISPMEQLYLTIACLDSDFRPGATTHQELHPTYMLSVLASLTPFSDFNQSPRNMYQCQMCKQTMGTPAHAYPNRVDSKMYRINTPQRPIVRTKAYNEYGMDEYAMGTNAVIAVIAYTGYDMEDAMIINKASFERGLMHGMVYTNKIIDLGDMAKAGERVSYSFCAPDSSHKSKQDDGIMHGGGVDEDGIISVGSRVHYGDVLAVFQDNSTGEKKTVLQKVNETSYVDQVRVIGDVSVGNASGLKRKSMAQHEAGDAPQLPLQKVSIKLRYQRVPQIGDKFASRHGQKGVMSQLWPEESMPFTDSGLMPDILFNPHGFPSRMTIGMMIETVAAKSGALNGVFQDATPFRYSGQAIDHFGEQLAKAGYDYYGTETLYSGVSGEPLECRIFTGIVYYQRLRHMVSDKYQVRAEGPINNLTHQPVKGRKAHGGIRLGEMERDSLLAHGASFMLNDRLMNCSDFDKGTVCGRCGSYLSTSADTKQGTRMDVHSTVYTCNKCKTGEHCKVIKMPYVLKYLVNELAAMNIKLQMTIQ